MPFFVQCSEFKVNGGSFQEVNGNIVQKVAATPSSKATDRGRERGRAHVEVEPSRASRDVAALSDSGKRSDGKRAYEPSDAPKFQAGLGQDPKAVQDYRPVAKVLSVRADVVAAQTRRVPESTYKKSVPSGGWMSSANASAESMHRVNSSPTTGGVDMPSPVGEFTAHRNNSSTKDGKKRSASIHKVQTRRR